MLSVVPTNYADYMKYGDTRVDRRPHKRQRPKIKR